MRTARQSYRLAVAVAVVTALFLAFGIAALGIIGDGGREDRAYLAVFAVLALGTLVARLRPRGMAIALSATAVTQVVVAVVALAGLPDSQDVSVLDVLALTAMYAGLFALSAWLFRRAAEHTAVAPNGQVEHPGAPSA